MERIVNFARRRRSSNTNVPRSRSRSTSDRSKEDEALRRLILTSDTPDFDQTIIRQFEAEGLKVKYLPFLGGGRDLERARKDLENQLNELEDDLEPGERYAVVGRSLEKEEVHTRKKLILAAYRKPAYLLLAAHHQSNTTTNPLPRLCALVAYYPEPPFDPHDPQFQEYLFPCEAPSGALNGVSTYSPHSFLPLQIHLADDQTPAFYENYTANPDKKRHRCHVFSYPESHVGFAEQSEKNYDRIDAQLAWSRTLDCIKRSFAPGPNWTVSDIETIWANHWHSMTQIDTPTRDTMEVIVGGENGTEAPESHYYYKHSEGPTVNCVPTLIGGTSDPTNDANTYSLQSKAKRTNPSILRTFHKNTFFPSGPPSQHLRLISRTTGPDRVVDEVLLTFDHTEEVPWLLPNVPPTNRKVQIPLVLTGTFCAGKLARQQVYWDQASVLVQVGLLDPGLVPGSFEAKGETRGGKRGVEKLPVCVTGSE